MTAPRHFSALARRSNDPAISWLMRLTLERPELVSLAAGFTDPATLPLDEMRDLCAEVLRDPRTARAALQYGSTPGLPELRRAVVDYWQRQDRFSGRATAVTADDVVITNGSQQLLYLVSEVLCDPGDLVLVEDPTYFVFLGIVEAMGLRAVGFTSIEHLKSKLEQLRSRHLLSRLKLLYLVTYFRNPTGHTWPAEAKAEILSVVRHYERAAGHPIHLIEDAAYRDLRFEGEDVISMKSFDRRPERVVYANTLTKPFATGVRAGYGILPRPLLRSVLRSKGNHDFGTANFLQALLARALREGRYHRHLPEIAAAYRRKRDAMLAALQEEFADASRLARYTRPQGGMYIWVELAGGVRTGVRSRLFRRALEAGVLYVPGEMCYCADPYRPVPRNHLRLSFGTPPIGQIRTGIQLLATALR